MPTTLYEHQQSKQFFQAFAKHKPLKNYRSATGPYDFGNPQPAFGIRSHRHLRYHRHQRIVRTTRSYHSSQNYNNRQNLTSGATGDAYVQKTTESCGKNLCLWSRILSHVSHGQTDGRLPCRAGNGPAHERRCGRRTPIGPRSHAENFRPSRNSSAGSAHGGFHGRQFAGKLQAGADVRLREAG